MEGDDAAMNVPTQVVGCQPKRGSGHRARRGWTTSEAVQLYRDIRYLSGQLPRLSTEIAPSASVLATPPQRMIMHGGQPFCDSLVAVDFGDTSEGDAVNPAR